MHNNYKMLVLYVTLALLLAETLLRSVHFFPRNGMHSIAFFYLLLCGSLSSGDGKIFFSFAKLTCLRKNNFFSVLDCSEDSPYERQ